MAIRIISAIVGIVIAIVVLFFSDTMLFNAAIAAISCVILYELFHVEKFEQYKISCAICMIFTLAMPFMALPVLVPYRYLFAVTCVFALFVTYLVQHKTLQFDKLSFMITTTVLVTLSMCCLILIKDTNSIHGVFYVGLSLGGAWVADSAAYFVGTALGKHKLCPEISPKKTVEGAVGGIVITGLIFALAGFIYVKIMTAQGYIIQTNYIILALLGMVCAVLGMVGDLTASLLKRQCQIKDYGKIMPGHGGMLDRFDSVLFVVPFMRIFLSYVNIFQ